MSLKVFLESQAILLRAERDEADAVAANQQVRLKQQRQQLDKDKTHVSGERLTATKRRQLQDRDELKVRDALDDRRSGM